MDIAEELKALEEIKSLKARYCRFIDTKHWNELQDLFAPDASFDTEGSGMPPVDGLQGFLDVLREGLKDSVSVHHCHCPEIEFTSETTANAVWPMEDIIRWPDDPASPLRSLHGYGYYRETYAKHGGKWKIKKWKVDRLRVDMEEK